VPVANPGDARALAALRTGAASDGEMVAGAAVTASSVIVGTSRRGPRAAGSGTCLTDCGVSSATVTRGVCRPSDGELCVRLFDTDTNCMAETEHITVADFSDGPNSGDNPGEPVSLPVVELLTGRGFVTGKSGSGKSNSASVIAEKLLDNGFGLLIVDVDGEYYGLKEEYEVLHAGADEECDIQVTADHAEKLADLALEGNVPIILDVSSFLDENEAEAVLTDVARHLFAKEKKQKQPFLLLVEEVHEYIPERGSVGECGKMLIKIGKRGRKHGLGICGISQRPANVKKDFITQCDWLVWHRLTWDNDTSVVRRVLDGEYAEAVEDLDAGEGFLMTDWSESVRRVQFRRKRTFDAGATPGLDDFERPELKSISGDLVAELEEISDEKEAREDRIAELTAELDRKNSRIAELEAELQDARDLRRMADQFVDALADHVEGAAPGRTEQERMRSRHEHGRDDGDDGLSEDEAGEAFAVTAANEQPEHGTTNGDTNGSGDAFSASEILEAVSTAGRSDTVEWGTTGDTSDGADTGDGDGGGEPLVVRELKAEVGGLETTTREMLDFYRRRGPGTPVEAHFAAGGDGDRTRAYAHNRHLRVCGLVEHVGRGHYDYQLRALLRQELDDLDEQTLERYVTNVESVVLD
jgi:hypothetical protein